MYTVAVSVDLIAQHYLIGGDWGAENELHSHPYVLELQLEGEQLDRHGYLVDIVEVERALEQVRATYRDHTLNELAPFAGLNPSLEHFARIVCESLSDQLPAPNLSGITVKLWESRTAWASYRITR